MRPSWKSIFASSPKPKGQLTLNLVGSKGATYISKVAKIIQIRNPMAAIFKNLFWTSIERIGQLTQNLLGNIGATCTVNQKKLKSFQSKIQDGHHNLHLENRFWTSFLEPKGQLTWNLVGSIRAFTCRSVVAEIVLIGNLKWPPWRPSWNLFWTSSPE